MPRPVGQVTRSTLASRQVWITKTQPVRKILQPIAPIAGAPQQGSAWITAARPVAALAMPQSGPQPPQPEVVVDYSVLTRYAAAASYIPAPMAYATPVSQVQQLGQVTIDYSVLQ
jgi:hypothetical protein